MTIEATGAVTAPGHDAAPRDAAPRDAAPRDAAEAEAQHVQAEQPAQVICVVIGLGTFVAVPFDLAASIGSWERLGARIVNGSMFGIGTLGVALALSAATMAGGATRSGCRLRPASAGSGALDSTRTSQRASASRCRCLNSLRCLASLP